MGHSNTMHYYEISYKFARSLDCLSRFDGRALLDFIREPRRGRPKEMSEEEEELEEFVNFERYRDLIKHRRRGCRYFFEFDNALNFDIFDSHTL